MSEAAYLPKLRKKFPDLSDAEIELALAKSTTLQKMTGLTQHDHRMRAMALLRPDRVNHAWRERMIRSWWECKKAGKQEICWVGAAMSGKTGALADLLMELWWEDPENTTIQVASPYKTATEGRLWAEIVESFTTSKMRYPKLPGTLVKSRGQITLGDTNLRAGLFMVTVDNHGKMIGSNNRDVSAGNLILAVDELPNIENNATELIFALGNMKMRPSFTLLCAGNFAETNDGLGIVAEPDDPLGYEALDVDKDIEWETRRNGRVYRFDGMQSPNVVAQKDDLPFLTRWAVVRGYIERGLTDTAEFFRWIRSFPVLGMGGKTVTNVQSIRASGALLDPQWTGDPIIKGGACDPGFTGDPCILLEYWLGTAVINGEEKKTLHFPEHPVKVPIRIKASDSPEEINAQIVAFSKKWATDRGIAPRYFGFDGSMRAGIVQRFMRDWSNEVVAIDFGGKATDRPVPGQKGNDPGKRDPKTWHEGLKNFVTELWFCAGLAIQSGQIRGLRKQLLAMRQLCARTWKWAGEKKQIQPKDEYKKFNSQQSPNEADALVIAVEMARRNGLSIEGSVINLGTGLKASLEALFPVQYAFDGLRPGQLYGSSPEKPFPRYIA